MTGTYACIIRQQTREAACTPMYIMCPGGGTVRINVGNESELERRFGKALAVGAFGKEQTLCVN